MKRLVLFLVVFTCNQVLAQFCVPNTNSLNFNGTSSYVAINSQNNLNDSTAITVEAWIYATQLGTTSAANSIFCKHGWSTPGEQGYVLRAGNNSIAGTTGIVSFNFAGRDTNGTATSWKEVMSPPSSITLNAWYHVAGTYDGYDIKMYVNGALVATTPFRGTIIPSVLRPKIGRLADTVQATGGRFWAGMIDEVRIFNRALSQTEISDSMSIHIVPTAQTGLVGYWRMNDGSGTTVTDFSTGNNTGGMMGATWSTLVPFNQAPPTPTISFVGGQLIASTGINVQWYLGSNPIPGETHQVYVPQANGSYHVVVTGVNGCVATSNSYSVTTLTVNENSLDHVILISPNPAHDVVYVSIQNVSAVDRMEVTDITGKKVIYKSEIISGLMAIPVEQFAKGIYLAKFYGKDAVLTKKLVIE